MLSCLTHCLRYLTGVLFALFFASLTYAAQPLVLAPEFEHTALGLYSDIFEDPSRELSLDDVLTPEVSAQFIPGTSENPNFGLTKSAYWFRLKIRNPQAHPLRMKLLLQPHYQTLAIYTITKDGQRTAQLKDLDDLVGRKLSRQKLIISAIDFAPLETLTVYIRITNTLPLYASLSLWQDEALQDYFQTEAYFLGIAWGILLLIIGVNLLLFLFTRELRYFYYVLFIGGFLLFRMYVNLWGTIYLSPVSGWNNYIITVLILIFMNAGILYYLKMFKISEKAPQLHKVAKGRMALNILFLVFPYFIGIQWTFKIIMLTNIILFYFMWVLIPLNWKDGKLSSRISVMALGIFYAFAIIQMLRVLGVFPNNWLTTYAIEIGLIFQSLFHFASMDALVREEFKDKEAAQKQALRNMRQADEMKDQLLTNTSHELRTPLHGMIGLVDMILSSTAEKLTRKTKRQLQLVAENARRLNTMVGNLLDLSALQGQRVKMNMESVVLHTLVESVLNLSQPLAGEKPILLQNEIPQNLPPVSADPNSLQQILLNLSANALKYTDSGKVTISAHLLKNKVRIEVEDSGVGIPQEQLENIFESFRRGESAKIREQEGLGLGLSICQELLKAHGSHLEVRSVPQEGSVFSFNLPVSTAPAVEKTIKLSAAEELQKLPDAAIQLPIEKLVTNRSTKLQHILVVDDDYTNLEIVFGHVAGQYNLTSCDTGQDALNVLETDSSIRLVLLDVMMPKLDGFEVCELIREKHSAEELPVLLLTALDNEENIAQGYLSGANDYLVKPFRKTELLARIAAQLRLSSFHRGDNTETESAKIIVRQTLVATLQMSLEIWETETGKTELDLAQKSNIWGTHLDNKTGTYRSRGLQKYLSEVSLPAYPRWRKVIQTAQFVIRHCPENSASHKKLLEQLDLLTRHLQDALL